MHAYTDYKKGLTQPQEISAEESTKKKTRWTFQMIISMLNF